jgi:hypothetical protein
LNDTSSSSAKPWVHHTVAVVAAELARWGLADVPTAAMARELRLKVKVSVRHLPFFRGPAVIMIDQ